MLLYIVDLVVSSNSKSMILYRLRNTAPPPPKSGLSSHPVDTIEQLAILNSEYHTVAQCGVHTLEGSAVADACANTGAKSGFGRWQGVVWPCQRLIT
jgi:hypothetical protein